MPSQPTAAGVLYIVATPIGNRDDLSPRALATLRAVDIVACEDTRHTGALLTHFGVHARLVSVHEHSEAARVAPLLASLAAGHSVALVSDAGTPLVSDPGFRLVREAHAAGIPVRTVPGPSAVMAALSVSGQPSDRFVFEGFLPPRRAGRRAHLARLAHEERTLIFFESPHRIEESLADLATVFGADRPATLARELTKQFESVVSSTLGELVARATTDPDLSRGEIVLVVAGLPESAQGARALGPARTLLRALAPHLPTREAVALVQELTGLPRNLLYRETLAPPDDAPPPETDAPT